MHLRSDGARTCEAAHVAHGLHLHSVPGEISELHPEGLGVLLEVQPQALWRLYGLTEPFWAFLIGNKMSFHGVYHDLSGFMMCLMGFKWDLHGFRT